MPLVRRILCVYDSAGRLIREEDQGLAEATEDPYDVLVREVLWPRFLEWAKSRYGDKTRSEEVKP